MVDALPFDNTQFFILLGTIIWLYLIGLCCTEKELTLHYIQFIVHIPITLMYVSNAFLQSEPYGYLIGFSISLISGYFVFIALAISFGGSKK